ncbi:hypothetical protein LNKW23_02590 [Paralimibaculum aggregatum]|uniref:Uncharacterized protein n=1 Tax=Paralimibaculum aggregatum TaxID=3036245 RepID=A0ABQ6LCE8_9RHOB|nr:hypothetical protein LNKW23_02590 [Limibaculum sp. NKW23]
MPSSCARLRVSGAISTRFGREVAPIASGVKSGAVSAIVRLRYLRVGTVQSGELHGPRVIAVLHEIWM